MIIQTAGKEQQVRGNRQRAAGSRQLIHNSRQRTAGSREKKQEADCMKQTEKTGSGPQAAERKSRQGTAGKRQKKACLVWPAGVWLVSHREPPCPPAGRLLIRQGPNAIWSPLTSPTSRAV
ncbi:hypothetical protein PoB_000631900 [Plakobranchus ocellatus]|uniref:Small EDRK-rich factor-like N-terminal domain-containing protein n=1 Tax=Plakobranchus ocellatus TaxID=259542 RepID=A0AAV3YA29_9GAST|nr:hypothetical protein PoB_000631900 [Plakobranchus ocellatus]